uniref:Putative secreted protein n=1 Tax=Anopheles darlingi TaxID=43151 RepID=A0A2M4DGR7_ANODA
MPFAGLFGFGFGFGFAVIEALDGAKVKNIPRSLRPEARLPQKRERERERAPFEQSAGWYRRARTENHNNDSTT